MELYNVNSKHTVGLVCDSSGHVSVIIANPNFKKADVEKMLQEQVEALNNQPEPNSEPESEAVCDEQAE
jgi:hypothetical protein